MPKPEEEAAAAAPAEPEAPPVQAFILTGEFVRSLSPEQVAMFASTAMGGAVELHPLYGATLGEALEQAPLVAEQARERTPVQATSTLFQEFGESRQYPSRRAGRAWDAVTTTFNTPQRTGDPYPPLQKATFETEQGPRPGIDLWSVYDRLKISELSGAAWGLRVREGEPDNIAHFLAHLVHTKLPLKHDQRFPFQTLNR